MEPAATSATGAKLNQVIASSVLEIDFISRLAIAKMGTSIAVKSNARLALINVQPAH